MANHLCIIYGYFCAETTAEQLQETTQLTKVKIFTILSFTAKVCFRLVTYKVFKSSIS